MIKLQLIGNLGKDAVISNYNGKQVLNFNVAHTEKYKNQQGVQTDKTIWVECSYWSESKIAPYLKKGTQVYVEGQPEVRTYAKNDGTTGVSLSLRVQNVQLLGSKDGNSSQQQSSNSSTHDTPPSSDISGPVDDLPF